MIYNYDVIIHRPYGTLDPVITWCKSECRNWAWNVTSNEDPPHPQDWSYQFYFAREQDYMAFILRWTK